jgi:predicted enzyme related to lactoylglutathione lyase
MRAFSGILVFSALLLALGLKGETQKDLRNAHGIFTGDIKPVLYVTDVEQAAPFYRDVLGFDFQGYAKMNGQPYYAEMAAAEVKFGLHKPTIPVQESKVGQQRLYFRIENLPAHRSRVLAWGREAGEIKTTDWMDMFLVRDPDGNEIVFAVTHPERHTINPWNTQERAAQGKKAK